MLSPFQSFTDPQYFAPVQLAGPPRPTDTATDPNGSADMLDPEMILLAVPLIVALVEMSKRAGMATTLTGPAAIVYGVAVVALIHPDPYSRNAALTAIAAGLAANGTYSQADMLAEKIKEGRARGTSN